VLKAIYQGAYLRTYHLWEKGCREYLASQGVEVPEFSGKFPEYVKSGIDRLRLARSVDFLMFIEDARHHIALIEHLGHAL
jgi:hypothetical protein